jgi:hypothetical protein
VKRPENREAEVRVDGEAEDREGRQVEDREDSETEDREVAMITIPLHDLRYNTLVTP